MPHRVVSCLISLAQFSFQLLWEGGTVRSNSMSILGSNGMASERFKNCWVFATV